MSGIRFVGMEIRRAVFPLRVAFAHNLAIRDAAETLLVTLQTASGRIGFGQALPRAYLTGETPESVERDIRLRWWPLLRDMTLPSGGGFEEIAECLSPLFFLADAERRNASFAAVELAALDAWGKAAGKPAGLPHVFSAAPLDLVAAIPATSPAKAAWLARILKWLGYRRFKVKVGRDAGADTRRIDAVRRSLGASCRLNADANGAWDWDEAIARMRTLRAAGVRLVEEPLTREAAAAADFRALERLTGMETMADESLCTCGDGEALVARGSPSWWNVRLAKNGGFAGVDALARCARQHDVRIYGGILVGETGVLAAAGRNAFLGCGAVCGEYGFSRVFLRGDPFRGAPAGYRGRMGPPSRAGKGFGVYCKRGALDRCSELLWRV